MKTGYGIIRIVFLIGKYVFKIPNFRCSHRNWLQGCSANWNERVVIKTFKDTEIKSYSKIAPTYFCIWFGLLSIQQRTTPLKRDLNNEEKEYFKHLVWGDNKRENFGGY